MISLSWLLSNQFWLYALLKAQGELAGVGAGIALRCQVVRKVARDVVEVVGLISDQHVHPELEVAIGKHRAVRPKDVLQLDSYRLALIRKDGWPAKAEVVSGPLPPPYYC
jgi:hypothetical protein